MLMPLRTQYYFYWFQAVAECH